MPVSSLRRIVRCASWVSLASTGIAGAGCSAGLMPVPSAAPTELPGADDAGTVDATEQASTSTSSTSTSTSSSSPPPAAHAWSSCAAAHDRADAGHATSSEVVGALERSLACWLTASELQTLDAHHAHAHATGPWLAGSYAALDRAVRHVVPAALDAANRHPNAVTLRALPLIRDEASRAAAEAALRHLLPQAIADGALPHADHTSFAPTIVLDDGHGCTLDHVPSGTHVSPADATIAFAALTASHLAERPPAGAPATLFIVAGSGLATTACFAAMTGVERPRVIEGLEQAVDAIAAAR